MKIKFIPQNIEVDVDPNKSIMRIAHENDLPVKSVCNGLPSCAECRVLIDEGEHNVLPPTSEELALIGTGHFVDRRRLACQLKCFGPMVIDLAEQVEKEKSLGNKRPQGNLRKDSTEQSLAVTGNLIDSDEALLKDEELNINEDSIEGDKVSSALSGVSAKSTNKRSNKNNRNNKRRSGKANASAKPGSGEIKNTEASKNKKRNRNRNRNRKNTNKPKSE